MPHISFSALKNWDFCPFYHKLTYIDRIKIFEGNVYTAFGTALHETCEEMVKDNHLDYENHFKKSFRKELEEIQLENDKKQKSISKNFYVKSKIIHGKSKLKKRKNT